MRSSDLHYLKNYPLSILLKKILLYPFRSIKERRVRRHWEESDPRFRVEREGELKRLLSGFELPEDPITMDGRSAFLLDAFLQDRNDILGSGFVDRRCDAPATGIEGYLYSPSFPFGRADAEGSGSPLAPQHSAFAKEVLKELRDPGSLPLDRHRDMKSGFRWPGDRWWKRAMKAHRGCPGADPKAPMEFSRLQDLPRIPLMVRISGRDPRPYVERFHDRVLDFVAHDPPGMSLSWMNSMDVGIRLMNLLMAWDLFKGIDEEGLLKGSFHAFFLDTVYLHARYILDHLEYQDGLTGNHYLFNLLGLLFAGVYVDGSKEADNWFGFALEELVRELFKQFLSDGMNFENSTAYHRLSTEGILWGVSLVMGQRERLERMEWDRTILMSRWSHAPPARQLHSTAEQPFPLAFLGRLKRAGTFMKELTRRDDGRFPQFGDNDSGRAFRITPIGSFLSREALAARYEGRGGDIEAVSGYDELFDEDALEAFSTNAVHEALFDEAPSSRGGALAPIEYEMTRFFKKDAESGISSRVDRTVATSRPLPFAPLYEERTEISFGRDLGADRSQWSVHPVSGIHVYRTDRIHLCVSAWSGQGARHTLGHAHSDRLSFDLYADGAELIIDPGSYIYGAIPKERDRFRRGSVHSVPWVEGKEQLWWSEGAMGLFFARTDARCSLIDREDNVLSLLLEFRGVRHERTFKVLSDRLVLIDRSDHPFTPLLNRGYPHSYGYGKKSNEKERR